MSAPLLVRLVRWAYGEDEIKDHRDHRDNKEKVDTRVSLLSLSSLSSLSSLKKLLLITNFFCLATTQKEAPGKRVLLF